MQNSQTIFYIYTIIVFFITNYFSGKFVAKNLTKNWCNRLVIGAGGLVVLTIILFGFAFILPDEFIWFFFVPFLCTFIGLIAHLTFKKVERYNKMAADRTETLKGKK
jgi:hypothetical protein